MTENEERCEHDVFLKRRTTYKIITTLEEETCCTLFKLTSGTPQKVVGVALGCRLDKGLRW